MLPSLTRLSWAIPLCALILGCAPKIGKSCTLSTDCSQLGDRLCDTTQPEGYCTIFNCEPDTCPDSACVGFYAQLDPACRTSDDGRTPRFERTFCMAPCSSDSSCRDGYQCVELNDPNDPAQRGAKIVDIVNDIGATKVCMAAVTLPLSIPPVAPDICGTGDAGPPWTPYKPDAGTPDAGTGGAGGAGGAGGSMGSSSSGMGGMGGMGGMSADAGASA